MPVANFRLALLQSLKLALTHHLTFVLDMKHLELTSYVRRLRCDCLHLHPNGSIVLVICFWLD